MSEDSRFRAEWEKYRQRWRPRKAVGQDRISPGRILVVKLADIGDLLTATPSLRALRQSFPSAHISALVAPNSTEVLDGAPWVDEIVSFDKKLYDVPHQALRPRELTLAIGMAGALRRSQFDTVIVLHHLLTWWGIVKYGLLTLRIGARVRLGLDDGRGWFYTHKAPDGGFGYLHEVDYWLSTVGAIGARTQDRHLEMFVPPQADSEAESLLADSCGRPLIAFHPGSGTYSLARRWPVERFAEVADRLVDTYGAVIIIVGGSSEADLAREMASHMRNPAKNLAGTTGLKQLAAVLRRCALLVSNDSGVMHVASAMDTPVVAIFGPSNHRAWGPYFPDSIPENGDGAPVERSILVRSTRACSPCLYPNPYRKSSWPCEEVACLRDVQPDAVFNAACHLLETTGSTNSLNRLVV